MIGCRYSNHPFLRGKFLSRWKLWVFHKRCDGDPGQLLTARVIACAISLCLAFGAAEASAKQSAAGIVQSASHSAEGVYDLGALQPAPDSDSSTPASTSTVSSAEPVPELPTWAMILLCFAGLGLAGFRRGRKDRLSPGID
jgi:hypothetical protein